ncbi:menaquinone-dependent protoporphyrinogen IX dehydrogenase [Verrucomicrobia bacterium S94]|nr:menaquinone-dependent protoporphyrinogen IX dehydrogenase [Verrucomicrobia bacterium S94]
MEKILITYSTTDGHTKEICKKLSCLFEANKKATTIIPIAELKAPTLNTFHTVIVGASIRYGKHNRSVYRFINSNYEMLNRMNSGLFSVNLVARKPEKKLPETNPYFRKFIKQIPWQPNHLAVFAGCLNYSRYKLMDRMMIQLIMRMTKGPTNPDANIVFTDWNAVESFGKNILKTHTTSGLTLP